MGSTHRTHTRTHARDAGSREERAKPRIHLQRGRAKQRQPRIQLYGMGSFPMGCLSTSLSLGCPGRPLTFWSRRLFKSALLVSLTPQRAGYFRCMVRMSSAYRNTYPWVWYAWKARTADTL